MKMMKRNNLNLNYLADRSWCYYLMSRIII